MHEVRTEPTPEAAAAKTADEIETLTLLSELSEAVQATRGALDTLRIQADGQAGNLGEIGSRLQALEDQTKALTERLASPEYILSDLVKDKPEGE